MRFLKMHWYGALIFVFILTGLAVSSQELHTISQLKSDFALFRQALQEAHPGLYRYTTKLEFDSIFLQSLKKIDHDMTQQQFFNILLPVVSQIKCGHTKLHPDGNWTSNFYFNREKVFPWRLHFDENRAFILGNYTNSINVLPIGAELVSINGKPVSELIPEMLPAFFSDGNNSTFKYLEMDHFFSAIYANLFDGPDSFTVVYTENSKLNTMKVPSISHSVIIQYEKQLEDLRAKQPPYTLKIKSPDTALLTISSFWMESDDINFKKFLHHSFTILNEKKIKNLIIDLRNNEGGVDKRGALLMSYLTDQKFRYYDRLELTARKRYSFSEYAHLPAFYGILRLLVSKGKDGTYIWKFSKNLKVQKPQKNNFNGKVYVLINGASFSVTAEFASVAHYMKRATFIGEETGGGYYGNNSGTFVVVTLPNSKLNVGIPLMAYYLQVDDYAYPDRGVIPDFEVKPSLPAILSGHDEVLEFTLKHIESQKNQVQNFQSSGMSGPERNLCRK
jgi:hypothetical protein